MQYFIGIVPSEEYKEKIEEVQLSLKNNLLPDIVEPHITIKAQGGLTADKEWLKEVQRICTETSPFNLKIDKPAFFVKMSCF
ncbi:2'-5' RNA ligase family protein [Bacillus pinisoli]|uniref:2'-5' RNA ligase family protein n=1 Tax=Bacillus pinisoli TaxID=2901866 RepID=UPI001FF5D3A2|nr:2'-5' RNA ligase family protein [Bacillus pinisoli]